MIKATFTLAASGNVVVLDPSKTQGVPTKWEWLFKNNVGEEFKPEVMSGELTGRVDLPGILSVKLPVETVTITLRLVYFSDVNESSISYSVK